MALIQDTIGLRLMQLASDHSVWSQRTFGLDSERGPTGALRHLEKEAREVQAAPYDITEYADCLLLLLDASRRAGFSVFDLIEAGRSKLAINQERTWPRSIEGQPCEHCRPAPELGVIHADGGYPMHAPHGHVQEIALQHHANGLRDYPHHVPSSLPELALIDAEVA